MSGPAHGFPSSEFENRLARAQVLLQQNNLDALLVTTHPDLFYFSGFLTRFWESPTRPWFLVIPQTGMPIAVIPGIGEALMRTTWIKDIRTWVSPDLEDDGVSLLADTLVEIAKGGEVAVPSGHETMLRMPLSDFQRLNEFSGMPELTGDSGIMRSLRMVKSTLEVKKIETACGIAGRAFDRVSEVAHADVPMEKIFRSFQIICLEEGADWVPYLAGGSGENGYSDVISPATESPVKQGDVLMLDTGLVHDGYFCDYDRNYAIGAPNALVSDAHKTLIEATWAGFEAASPGRTASDLYHAMDKVLTGGEGRNDNGRLGHGLGINLTEWPSLIPSDHTVLESGMVLTLEPGIETINGQMLVHEENIVVTDDGARWLSTVQVPEIRVI